ncbi:succinylglutamate desuccinylase/aspartoacylase family protein [Marinobacter lacisalsi]|uniref:Succinylglutamate desuccinylase/aspartoacylase family protein n=1 Tax=Marinobacter lacisalsi TaxID=475979 RepID=A0ABV8QFP0_9GAMM
MRLTPPSRLLLPAMLVVAVCTGKAWAQEASSRAPQETAPSPSESAVPPSDNTADDSDPVRLEDEGPQVITDSTDTAPSPPPEGPEAAVEAPPVIELPEDESVEDITASDTDVSKDRKQTAGSTRESPAGDAPDADLPDKQIADEQTSPTGTIPETQPAQAEPFRLLSGEVLPGTTARLAWSPGIQISGLSQPTPVLVVNGSKPGPVMCMTGAVHGDELNGIEIIRRVIYDLDPDELSGTVVGIPIVNLQGFQQGSRYLADRRDLNRYFPGSEDGSLAHRIAHSLFEQVILNCDMLVDIHTGSLKRTNLPQLRADMDNPQVAELTKGFDSMVVVHSSGGPGMLRTATTESGIPAVTMEVGESMRIQEDQIRAGVNSVVSLMEKQGMTARLFQWGEPEPVYYQSHWIRANQGGILFSDVELGAYVTEGTILGTVSDPITNEQSHIRADADGRVIGMAVDQVVMAGFAAYHLGSKAENEEQAE